MAGGTLATILLVEDDPASASAITRALAACGYRVWHAENAADAWAVLRQRQPDLMLLDLTLPDVDGLVFCARLRDDMPHLPVVVCSAASIRERVLAFQLNVDDVIPKPFEMAELEARLTAVLRRQRAHNSDTISETMSAKLGNLHIDCARWRATVDDHPLDLTPTEFQLLVFLADHIGQIVSRTDLARGVWGNESMSASRTVDAYVRRLRSKLEARNGPRLLGVQGLGYLLASPILTAA